MKKLFSRKWKASRQTRKKRKYIANAPLHIKHKFLSANLSKELRKKLGIRNLEVRKGDNVKVMRGDFEFKKKTGKISQVNIKKTRVTIEGMQRKKKDGTKVNIYFHPSNLQILDIKEDKFRLNTEKENKPKVETKENAPDKK